MEDLFVINTEPYLVQIARVREHLYGRGDHYEKTQLFRIRERPKEKRGSL